VGSGCRGSITGSEGELCLSLACVLEFSEDGLGVKGEDLGIEDLSVLKDLGDLHLVLEWIDLQFVQKDGLSSINLFSGNNDLLGGDNFNLGLDNLGLDLQVLEESSLLWVESGGSSWDEDILWCNHTGLGWGWSDLFVEDSLDISEVSVGEDDVDVSLEEWDDLFDVFVEFPGSLSFLVVFITFYWFGVGGTEGSLHEGVLSHDHVSTDLSKLISDHADLLGGDRVGVDEHSVVVFSGNMLES